MRTVDRHGRPLVDRDASWLTAVSVVTLDPHRGFVNAMRYHLGHGTLVVDHWHAIRLANACVDDVRRRVQQDTLGHRRCKGGSLYGVVGCSRRPSDSPIADGAATRPPEPPVTRAMRSTTRGRSRSYSVTFTPLRRFMTRA